jgi:hypothetical protein
MAGRGRGEGGAAPKRRMAKAQKEKRIKGALRLPLLDLGSSKVEMPLPRVGSGQKC